MSPLKSHTWHTSSATERVVIGRSSAGQPRTYRLVRGMESSWATQLVASLRSFLS